MFASVTDVLRATEMLYGTLEGIACDYTLNDTEIGQLRSWLDLHANLLQIKPFSEVREMLDDALADGVLDEDERDDLMAWCQVFTEKNGAALDEADRAIRRLHGFLQGIAIDGEISDSEIHDLRDWLESYGEVRDVWPFNDAWQLVESILRDGNVSESERLELQTFCAGFSECEAARPVVHDRPDPVREPWMTSNAPTVLSIFTLCEKNPVIEFADNRFCVTGRCECGKRKVVEEVICGLGGHVQPNVTLDLNYLVIGGLSQPAWAFSTYGRKVEKVMNYRQRGATTAIVFENDFLLAADSTAQRQELT